jgi:hypothetical protein
MSDNSLQFQNLLFPHEPFNPRVVVLMGAWIVIIPALVDGILLLRIHAVYPYARTPHVKFFFVMGVPVLTIIARFINAAIFLSRFVKTINTSTDAYAGEALQVSTRFSPTLDQNRVGIAIIRRSVRPMPLPSRRLLNLSLPVFRRQYF